MAKPIACPWGAVYGGNPSYRTPRGRFVVMCRKRQAVRFYDAKGVQVGPEQTNVAPAVAYASYKGWRDPDGMTPLWMQEQGTREIRKNTRIIRRRR
jgi:hypothetical protein